MRLNFYVFSLYHNPVIGDGISDCLLTLSVARQANGVRASFLFVGDLNGHPQEWLGSKITIRNAVAVFDFANVSGSDHLIVGPTDARSGTLYLLITDVPDLVRVTVVEPIVYSDRPSLSETFRWRGLFQVSVRKFS